MTTTRWASVSVHWRAAEGRRRRSRGSVEVHTGQVQPRVGTPIEVPLPRKVRVAFIERFLAASSWLKALAGFGSDLPTF
jgi:hypothetical protein